MPPLSWAKREMNYLQTAMLLPADEIWVFEQLCAIVEKLREAPL